MTIKSIVDAFDKIRSLGLRGMKDDSTPALLSDLIGELENDAETAKNTIISKISEEELVKLMLMIQKCVVTVSAIQGDSAILLADIQGELQAYTHTVVLSVIGVLIEDEVL